VIAAATLGLLALAPGAAANTFHPTRSNDPNPNGCRRHDCSLREAVIKANNHPGTDKVVLEAKTYRLTREGDGEDGSVTGDLDALDNLKVAGRAPSKTAIKGDWATDADRLFDIPGPSTGLRISGLTLRDGESDSPNYGAAVNVLPGTSLTLKRTRVTRNHSK